MDAMEWSTLAVVGRIARTHGIRGHVFVNVDTDFPEERFRPGVELYINRDGRVEAVTVATVRFQQGRPVISLRGVDHIEAAEKLSGLELRTPVDRLVRLPKGTYYRHDLIGCRVETTTGEHVGIVGDVEGPIEACRLVLTRNGDEVLIPLASGICTLIDTIAKRIVVDPPEGLLDLNG